MIVYVNGRFMEYALAGVTRYAFSVLKEIDTWLEQNSHLQIILLVSSKNRYACHYQHIEVRQIGRMSGILWEQVELPFYTKGEFLLSLHCLAPVLKRNQVVVMHDAKFSRSGACDQGVLRRYVYYGIGCLLGKQAKRIIAISQFAAHDLEQGYHMSPKNMQVVLSGMAPLDADAGDVDIGARYGIFPKKYVLAVGGGRSKNNIVTAKAVEQLSGDMQFILAGDVPADVEAELQPYTKTKMIGRVTDAELVALYQSAFCLSFPSLVEGWGLPPVEAMMYGCPVIASRCESVPEVCGEGALYLDDPHSVGELKVKILQLEKDMKLYKKMQEKGYQNIARFDWKRTARGIMEVVMGQVCGSAVLRGSKQ